MLAYGRYGRAFALAFGALTLASSATASPSVVTADDRDQYTLFYRHPVNRQLFEQLAMPESVYRLGPRSGVITALSDVTVGAQQALGGSQSRYHGWFTADTYLSVRSVYGVDINMNLLALNPSASDGYRSSASVHPGLALHLYRKLFTLGGSPVLFDIMGPDLGWVTTGNGLLLESTPLEGILGVARWKHWELRSIFAGRAYWSDDDYITTSLSALQGKIQANLVNWQKKERPYFAVANGDFPVSSEDQSVYATLVTRLPVGEHFRIASEFGYHLQEKPRVGILGRADFIIRDVKEYAVHLGYQFRYYQAGFGPRDRISSPSWEFITPLQQDAYVTNPFEYLGHSADYEQWSHTLMVEGRVRLGGGLEAFANTELWLRYARAESVPKKVIYVADGTRAPGQNTSFYYHTGLRMYPWEDFPHRASLSVTNKQVMAPWTASSAVTRRFDEGKYWLLMGEVFL